MSDTIKHECGLATVRLRKPLTYFAEKYGTALWGLHKIFLLLEKQHNRGQDGAGVLSLKLNPAPGTQYMVRKRVAEPAPPWQSLINEVEADLQKIIQRYPEVLDDVAALQKYFDFAAEAFIGHVRYATHGEARSLEGCHPVTRRSNWRCLNLAIAGNFNLTNVDELLEKLEKLGQRPRYATDTETLLEGLGLLLDVNFRTAYDEAVQAGQTSVQAAHTASAVDSLALLRTAAPDWDGGYVFAGGLGHGELFVARDPHGIRPAYYYVDDEVIAAASERFALCAAFEATAEEINELPPAHALIIPPDGAFSVSRFTEPQKQAACTFERIYFSRGSDPDIYHERKALGAALVPDVLEAIDDDLENVVFSYIPNTARHAFLGLVQGLQDYVSENENGAAKRRVRVEDVVSKDTRLRTFISTQESRSALIGQVYDVTQGCLRPEIDTLVCLDDSIVRGATLRESILKSLFRLKPRRIVIVSSAPQIRYPDCYGIDMSQIEHFIAFEALLACLASDGQTHLLTETYLECKRLESENRLSETNLVKALYDRYDAKTISNQIATLLAPDKPLSIVFQRVENLRKAIPFHHGDWYFTGEYPTPGGVRVVNRAFMNFIEGKNRRAY